MAHWFSVFIVNAWFLCATAADFCPKHKCLNNINLNTLEGNWVAEADISVLPVANCDSIKFVIKNANSAKVMSITSSRKGFNTKTEGTLVRNRKGNDKALYLNTDGFLVGKRSEPFCIIHATGDYFIRYQCPGVSSLPSTGRVYGRKRKYKENNKSIAKTWLHANKLFTLSFRKVDRRKC